MVPFSLLNIHFLYRYWVIRRSAYCYFYVSELENYTLQSAHGHTVHKICLYFSAHYMCFDDYDNMVS